MIDDDERPLIEFESPQRLDEAFPERKNAARAAAVLGMWGELPGSPGVQADRHQAPARDPATWPSEAVLPRAPRSGEGVDRRKRRSQDPDWPGVPNVPSDRAARHWNLRLVRAACLLISTGRLYAASEGLSAPLGGNRPVTHVLLALLSQTEIPRDSLLAATPGLPALSRTLTSGPRAKNFLHRQAVSNDLLSCEHPHATSVGDVVTRLMMFHSLSRPHDPQTPDTWWLSSVARGSHHSYSAAE
jgi:hypothetical protein